MILAWSLALAHHDAAVTQLDATPAGPALAAAQGGVSTSLRLDLADYGRTLRGSRRQRSMGRATTVMATPTLAGRLPGGTGLAVSVPFGMVDLDGTRHVGLGDVRVELDQRLGRLEGRVGLSAPTGRYGADALSATEVHGEDGAIVLTTWDNRVSLGSGAWLVSAGLGLRQPLGDRFELGLSGNAVVPATETSDAIRWGTQLASSTGLTGELARERLWAGLAVDVRHRTHNRFVLRDEKTGELGPTAAGARSALGLAASTAVAVTPTVRCSLQVHVPLWQHVHGVQLAERVSGAGTCTATLRQLRR